MAQAGFVALYIQVSGLGGGSSWQSYKDPKRDPTWGCGI